MFICELLNALRKIMTGILFSLYRMQANDE